MRINEYKNLEEFKNEYIGIWAPSDGYWIGLEFKYKGQQYRLDTDFAKEINNVQETDSDNPTFSLFKIVDSNNYLPLENSLPMDELLESKIIDDRLFKDIIMDDETEILGKD